MKNFSYYLGYFLKEYLPVERNLSSNTIKSYTKTFKILINYLVKEKNIKLHNITFENITREIILDFLKYLEENCNNSVRTRNQRLAAIKSFYQYCSFEEIENLDNIKKILSIKTKKFPKYSKEYLTETEVKMIFDSIDTSTIKGRRNLLVIALLYDTGARASELINLKVENIRLEESIVVLTGKGNKQRTICIMENTRKLLINYFKENNISSGYVFQNKFSEKMNERFLRTVVRNVSEKLNKDISPHTFRKTRATHLLKKGINILYIQEFLGHESIITTQEYAKVLQKDKFEAIKKATPQDINNELPDWKNNKDLLNQLLNL